MPNTGRTLERLVAAFERMLLGTGFAVTPNHKVFDQDGNQMAEFDVQISGQVGSTSFKWLLECRDRPSEGPAPASWIQHLSGRKQLFQFDKVIAVSTTGFSPGAKEAAKILNIMLREVSDVEAISAEFGTIQFRLKAMTLELQGVADFVFPVQARAEALQLGTVVTDPEIRRAGEHNFLTLRQFVLRDFLQGSRIKEPERDQSITLTYESRGDIELRVGAHVLPVSGISIPVTVHYAYHPTTALSIKSYGEDGRVIGEEVALSTETDAEIIRNVVLLTKKDGQMLVVQSAASEIIRKCVEERNE